MKEEEDTEEGKKEARGSGGGMGMGMGMERYRMVDWIRQEGEDRKKGSSYELKKETLR